MQGQGSLIPLLGRPVGIVLMLAIVWIFISGVKNSRLQKKNSASEPQ
jgi:hypothetical protein